MMRTSYYQFLVDKIHPAEMVDFVKMLVRIKRRYVSVGDLKLFVDPVSHFGIRILRDEVYEPHVKESIEKILEADDTFIDLGGNEGYFSLVASKLVGKNGKVYCVEPQERLWPIILNNITTNECFNIQVLPIAIAEKKAEMELVLTPSINTGSSKILKYRRSFFWTRQKIKTFPLDEIIEDLNIKRIKLVKIDIEGYELFALKSASQSLKKGIIENLIIEIHPNELQQLHQSEDELVAFLDKNGYAKSAESGNLNLFTLVKSFTLMAAGMG